MHVLTDPLLITLVNIGITGLVTIILFFYRFIFPRKKINLSIILVIILILPTISIFRSGIFRAGDMRTHLPYLIGFFQSLKEGNIIPLWMGETCGKFGCPVFEFEYILPYYLGSFLHLMGFSFVTAVKLMLALPFIASGITMYLWAKEQFGKFAGFVAALVYAFSPYHLIILNLKGSAGEVLAFVFIPLLLLFEKRLVETNSKKYFYLLSISFGLLLLSNSSATISTVPFAVLYGFVVWISQKNHKTNTFIMLCAAYAYGLLLTAFYWLPALFEVKYTWLRFTTYGIFIPILDYIYSPTDFGLLYQGHHGEYHQFIGYPNLIGVIFATILLFRNKIEKKFRLLLIYFLVAFAFLFYMFFPIAKPIWDSVTLLHSFIGQSRLLVPISLVTAAIVAIIISKIKNQFILYLLCYLIVTTTLLNWANRAMVPVPLDPIAHDSEVYTEYFKEGSPVYIQRYQLRRPLKDQIVTHPPKRQLEFLSGKGEIVNQIRKQQRHEYLVSTDVDSVLRENTYYFPGWKVFINNKEIPILYENTHQDSFGKITFRLKKGLYKVVILFTDTPLRSEAKYISLAAIVGGLLAALYLLLQKKARSVLSQ